MITSWGRPRFSQHSIALIRNIYNNARMHPMYQKYDVSIDGITYAGDNSIAIDIWKNGQFCNKFLFCPSYNNNGKIGSVAIYGINLQGQKQAIERTMRLFGLPVAELNIDNGGINTYVDVILADY